MSLETLRRSVVRPINSAAAELLRDNVLPHAADVETYHITDDLYRRYFPLFNDLHR